MTEDEKVQIAQIKANLLLSVRKDVRNIKKIPMELLVDKQFMNEIIKATENYCLTYLDFLKKETKNESVMESLYQRRLGEVVKMVSDTKKARKEYMQNTGIYKASTKKDDLAQETKRKFNTLRED